MGMIYEVSLNNTVTIPVFNCSCEAIITRLSKHVCINAIIYNDSVRVYDNPDLLGYQNYCKNFSEEEFKYFETMYKKSFRVCMMQVQNFINIILYVKALSYELKCKILCI